MIKKILLSLIIISSFVYGDNQYLCTIDDKSGKYNIDAYNQVDAESKLADIWDVSPNKVNCKFDAGL